MEHRLPEELRPAQRTHEAQQVGQLEHRRPCDARPVWLDLGVVHCQVLVLEQHLQQDHVQRVEQRLSCAARTRGERAVQLSRRRWPQAARAEWAGEEGRCKLGDHDRRRLGLAG